MLFNTATNLTLGLNVIETLARKLDEQNGDFFSMIKLEVMLLKLKNQENVTFTKENEFGTFKFTFINIYKKDFRVEIEIHMDITDNKIIEKYMEYQHLIMKAVEENGEKIKASFQG